MGKIKWFVLLLCLVPSVGNAAWPGEASFIAEIGISYGDSVPLLQMVNSQDHIVWDNGVATGATGSVYVANAYVFRVRSYYCEADVWHQVQGGTTTWPERNLTEGSIRSDNAVTAELQKTCQQANPPPAPCVNNEIKQGTYNVPGKWPAALCIENCKFVQDTGLSMWIASSNETWFTNPRGTGVSCTESLGTLAANPLVWPEGKDLNPGVLPPLVQTPDGAVLPDQDKDGIPSGPAPAAGGDTDNNGDGKQNVIDPDVDGNGVPNSRDTDVDGDGVSNGGQSDRYEYPYASPAGSGGLGADTDIDGDGQPNSTDMDIDGDGIPNSKDGDIDGDGYSNSMDLDADGDGVGNLDDASPYGNGSTGDGTAGEEGDTDQDGDGVADEKTEEVNGSPGEVGTIPGASCPEGAICNGDGQCQEGEDPRSADCVGESYYQTRFEEFKDDITASGVFTIANGFSVPSGGSSSQSVDLGRLGGEQSLDWSQFSFVWAILKALFTLAFAWLSVKIITLGKA